MWQTAASNAYTTIGIFVSGLTHFHILLPFFYLLLWLSGVFFFHRMDTWISWHHLLELYLSMISGLLAGTVLSMWICRSYWTVLDSAVVIGVGMWLYHSSTCQSIPHSRNIPVVIFFGSERLELKWSIVSNCEWLANLSTCPHDRLWE